MKKQHISMGQNPSDDISLAQKVHTPLTPPKSQESPIFQDLSGSMDMCDCCYMEMFHITHRKYDMLILLFAFSHSSILYTFFTPMAWITPEQKFSLLKQTSRECGSSQGNPKGMAIYYIHQ